MKELVSFFKGNCQHFSFIPTKINYNFVKENRFNWKKINFIKIHNDSVHEIILTFFYFFLKLEININQFLFCTSQTTDQQMKCILYFFIYNFKAL